MMLDKVIKNSYETVIGLEVHVELATETKIFCPCKITYGAPPNTNICPICTGQPGTLPSLNRRVVEYAIRAGLATNCEINYLSGNDRKNYFYPDLPKAYQISQADRPLCYGGRLTIDTEAGEKAVGITRIHIEEDAGKLLHEEGKGTFIDLNRCGVPLIEIVSEPDLRSAEEAKEYLRALRSVIVYTGISECKMNEGSFRCDVNLSVRKKGDTELGVRTEMKNINSFGFVAKAIEYESERQIALIERGERVVRETRRFDPDSGKTLPMRTKEDAEDYRYFPEPDLPMFTVSHSLVERISSELPALPRERAKKYTEEYGLSLADARIISRDKSLSDYYEAASRLTSHKRTLANMLVSDLLSLSSEEPFSSRISAEHLASLAELFGEGVINSKTAKRLVTEMWQSDFDPVTAVRERGLEQIRDEAVIDGLVVRAAELSPKTIADYLAGKSAARTALFGKAMGLSGGKASPAVLDKAIDKYLSELGNR